MENEKITKGLIPWSKDEFQKVNSHLYKILQTPRDDWDLKYDSDIGLDPFHPLSQISKYMKKRYKNKALFQAHLVRYNNMIRFLREYEQDLIKENLLIKDQSIQQIKEALLLSLCILPYEETRINHERKIEYVFAYPQVVSKAKEFLKNSQ